MKNKLLYSLIILIIIVITVIAICFVSQKSTLTSNHDDINSNDGHGDSDNTLISDTINIENADEIIEESDYYKLVRNGTLLYCYFYDDNHTEVKKEGPLAKMPRITTVQNGLVKFTVQAGTGIGTRWGYYYDTEKNIFSEKFGGIFDECEDKVACVGLNKVIVSNIFDSSKYYKEFSEFSYPFSQVATPITNVKFSSDGNSIIVSYLTGEDYQEVTEMLPLFQNTGD